MSNELKEKALNLLNALPKCMGNWVSGSGGHAVWDGKCSKFATWLDGNWNYCDEHRPMINGKVHPSCIHGEEVSYIEEADDLLKYINNMD